MASQTYSNTPGWVKGAAVAALLAAVVGVRMLSGDAPVVPATEDPAAQTAVTADAIKKLQKTDLKIGTGEEVKEGMTASMNYKGTLDDGTVFDQSKPGQPFTFPLGQGQVIKGWDLGIPGMRVGGKRKLVIPAELAYGAEAKGKIPANSQLTFEVELLKVEQPGGPPGMPPVKKAGPEKKFPPITKLKITELKVGTGETARPGMTLSVRYRGSLQDGTVFDQNLDGEPFLFQLGQGHVIPGWDEGLVGMKVGGKRRLNIPSAKAYGAKGTGSSIPPNADLNFDVELLKVQ